MDKVSSMSYHCSCAVLVLNKLVFPQGIPTVERAVINQDKGKYNLLVEG
jgi:hypothetical protein